MGRPQNRKRLHPHRFITAIAPADEAILVTTPDITALRNTDRVTGLLECDGIKDIKMVVNRVRTDIIRGEDMMSVLDVQEMLGLPLLGVVPEDAEVIRSTNRRRGRRRGGGGSEGGGRERRGGGAREGRGGCRSSGSGGGRRSGGGGRGRNLGRDGSKMVGKGKKRRGILCKYFLKRRFYVISL